MNVMSHLYHATELSWADGINGSHTLLMRTKVGTVGPKGTVQAEVPGHDVVAYRLRPLGAPLYKRDEL